MLKPDRSLTSLKTARAGLRVLLNAEEIDENVSRLACEISRDYPSGEVLLIGVLKGAFVFLSDLVRRIDVPVQIDFVWLSSYIQSTDSAGEVRLVCDLSTDVAGRQVVIVEDIIDTGCSIAFLKDLFAGRGAYSVRVCTLLDKPTRRVVEVYPDYVGFSVPNVFVVGYGIDYGEQYRDLPDICVWDKL